MLAVLACKSGELHIRTPGQLTHANPQGGQLGAHGAIHGRRQVASARAHASALQVVGVVAQALNVSATHWALVYYGTRPPPCMPVHVPFTSSPAVGKTRAGMHGYGPTDECQPR